MPKQRNSVVQRKQDAPSHWKQEHLPDYGDDGEGLTTRNLYLPWGYRHYVLLNWYHGKKYIHLRNRFNPSKRMTIDTEEFDALLNEIVPVLEEKFSELEEELNAGIDGSPREQDYEDDKPIKDRKA